LTRDELLERRRVLLRLYADPQSDEQAVEVARELYANTQALKDHPQPRKQAPRSPKPSRGRNYGWNAGRSRDYAAGRD
jgi:hypothetical protein